MEAFAVKNASVLKRPQGVYRTVLSVSELFARAAKIKDPQELMKLMAVNQLNSDEIDYMWKQSGIKAKQIAPLLENPETSEKEFRAILSSSLWRHDPQIQSALLKIVPHAKSWRLFQSLDPLIEAKHPEVQRLIESYLENSDLLNNQNEAAELLTKMGKLGIKSKLAGNLMLHSLRGWLNKSIAIPNNKMLLYAVKNNLGFGIYDEAQKKQLFELLQEGAKKDLFSLDEFTESLLANGQYRKEIYDLLWAQLSHETRLSERWFILLQLVKNFPQDAATINEIARYWHESVGQMYNPMPQNIAKALENSPGAIDVKQELFKCLERRVGISLALDSLPSFPLNDHDWATYIDADANLANASRRLESLLPMYAPKIGPESAAALARATLISTEDGRIGYSAELREILKAAWVKQAEAVRQALLQELEKAQNGSTLLRNRSDELNKTTMMPGRSSAETEILRADIMKNLRELGKQQITAARVVNNLNDMVDENTIPFDAKLQIHTLDLIKDASLSPHKRNFQTGTLSSKNTLWGHLDLSNSEVSERFQKMLMDPKFFEVLKGEILADRLKRISGPSLEFLEYLEPLNDGTEVGKRQLLAATEDSYDYFHNLGAYLRQHPAVPPSGCGEQFASLLTK